MSSICEKKVGISKGKTIMIRINEGFSRGVQLFGEYKF